jgi:hypothetical protein
MKNQMKPMDEYAVIASELFCIGTFIICTAKAIFDLFYWKFDLLTLLLVPLSLVFYAIIALLNFIRINGDRHLVNEK